MATQKVIDVAMDAQVALKQRIAEIQEFLKMSGKEIESLDSRRESVVNEMNNAERDLRRATRSLEALLGEDEIEPERSENKLAGLAEMSSTAPQAPYYPEGTN